MKQEVLRLERVTLKKGDSLILDNFSMSIMEGDIMGLLPLDTYGLDELLELLVHNLPLYYGYLYYMEKRLHSWKDDRYTDNPISLIDSQSTLVNGMNVATNIYVYRSEFHQEILRSNQLSEQLKPYLEDLELNIDPETPVEKLSMLEKVIVEILRAVISGHHLIILREISTVLSEKELKVLFRVMRHYVSLGFSFLYVSLHYEEIQQICTRAAIMQNAAIEIVLEEQDLKSAIGKQFYLDYYDSVTQHLKNSGMQEEKPLIFEARHMNGEVIRDLDFHVYAGECLVIQTLDASLFTDMVDILEGNEKQNDAVFLLEEKKVVLPSSRQIAVVKEEPWKSMLFEEMSVIDNLCISMDHRAPAIWINRKIKNTVKQEFLRTVKDDFFDKRISELTQIEKIELIYMRILLQSPKLVFLEQPFKGADVEVRHIIWELQETLLKRGISIVILAVNMADSLAVANRILRIDSHMNIREYQQKEFSTLPQNLPWSGLYRKDG